MLSIPLLLLGAACSDDEPADDQKALCTAADDVKTSLAAVRDVNVAADGTDALKTALADLKTSITGLADAAGSSLDDEVAAVQDAADQVGNSLDASKGESISERAGKVADSISDLAAAVGDLGKALKPECG